MRLTPKNTFESGPARKPLMIVSGPLAFYRPLICLPLERVQIDHTQVDVIVVDEGDRLPIGRPCLMLAIDVASRAVFGFSVSLERPSVVSVALTLVQAVLPKDLWLADRQLEVRQAGVSTRNGPPLEQTEN